MLQIREIKNLLDEGANIDVHDYAKECRTYSAKTFYYFCERLAQYQSNVSLPSPVLREYIVTQLEGAGIKLSNKFNPEGWFGFDWTERVNGHINDYCREEYIEILERTDRDPYSYQIRSKYFQGIRKLLHPLEVTLKAVDIAEPQPVARYQIEVNRIVRDTSLTRRIKEVNNFECQICGLTLELGNGKRYVEAHHLKPLGEPHNGPDVEENIICVCPNHHALLDYGAITLEHSKLAKQKMHRLGKDYVEYHNKFVFGKLNNEKHYTR